MSAAAVGVAARGVATYGASVGGFLASSIKFLGKGFINNTGASITSFMTGAGSKVGTKEFLSSALVSAPLLIGNAVNYLDDWRTAREIDGGVTQFTTSIDATNRKFLASAIGTAASVATIGGGLLFGQAAGGMAGKVLTAVGTTLSAGALATRTVQDRASNKLSFDPNASAGWLSLNAPVARVDDHRSKYHMMSHFFERAQEVRAAQELRGKTRGQQYLDGVRGLTDSFMNKVLV